jgi:hypothetical protein
MITLTEEERAAGYAELGFCEMADQQLLEQHVDIVSLHEAPVATPPNSQPAAGGCH